MANKRLSTGWSRGCSASNSRALTATSGGTFSSGTASSIHCGSPAILTEACCQNTNRMPASNTTRSEEHTSELQSLMRISYAVFCLKKKTNEESATDLNQEHNRQTHK